MSDSGACAWDPGPGDVVRDMFTLVSYRSYLLSSRFVDQRGEEFNAYKSISLKLSQ
jgi:hypothetical protein